MESMRNAFQRYLNENPEIHEVLNTYNEIEGVYRELLEAMGPVKQVQPGVEDSAKITISLPDAPVWANNNGGEPGEAKGKAKYSANS
jgi:hypothetical protein